MKTVMCKTNKTINGDTDIRLQVGRIYSVVDSNVASMNGQEYITVRVDGEDYTRPVYMFRPTHRGSRGERSSMFIQTVIVLEKHYGLSTADAAARAKKELAGLTVPLMHQRYRDLLKASPLTASCAAFNAPKLAPAPEAARTAELIVGVPGWTWANESDAQEPMYHTLLPVAGRLLASISSVCSISIPVTVVGIRVDGVRVHLDVALPFDQGPGLSSRHDRAWACFADVIVNGHALGLEDWKKIARRHAFLRALEAKKAAA